MVKLNMRSFLWGVLIVIVLCNAYLGEGKKLDPTPTPWPKQFHSILFINNSGSLQVTDLWYDWSKGRNFNIIQNQLGRKLYDLEWDNGTSFYYYLDKDECKRTHVDVGILRPNWLEGATLARNMLMASSVMGGRRWISYGTTRILSPTGLCIGVSSQA